MESHLITYLKAVFSITTSGMISWKRQKHIGIGKNSTNLIYFLPLVRQEIRKVLILLIEKLAVLKENIEAVFSLIKKKAMTMYGVQSISQLVDKQVIKWL